jgi:hypothetical protein
VLGSLTPLGERGRQSRWWLTACAYVLGTVLGAFVIGSALGLAGEQVVSSVRVEVRLALLATLCLCGLVLDLDRLGPALPTTHRQVSVSWLHTYRGWVYGFGFGFQLGLGFVTVVNASAIYLMFAAAFLSGSAPAGAAVTVSFGLIRGLSILRTHPVRSSSDLRDLSLALDSTQETVRVALLLTQCLIAALVIFSVLTLVS